MTSVCRWRSCDVTESSGKWTMNFGTQQTRHRASFQSGLLNKLLFNVTRCHQSHYTKRKAINSSPKVEKLPSPAWHFLKAFLITSCNNKMSFSLNTSIKCWIFAARPLSSHEASMLFQETQPDVSDVLSVNIRRLRQLTIDLWAWSNVLTETLLKFDYQTKTIRWSTSKERRPQWLMWVITTTNNRCSPGLIIQEV